MVDPSDETRRTFLKLTGAAIGTTGFVGIAASDTATTTNHAWSSFQNDTGNTGSSADGNDPGPGAWVDWSEQVSDRGLYSPTVVDGIAYVSDSSGGITAFDVDSRNACWTTHIRGLDYAPTVVGDTVYVAGTDLVALSAEDGSERWRFEIGVIESSPVTVADGIAFFKTSDVNGQGACWAIDTETGTKQWQVRLPSGKDGETPSAENVPPAVVDGTAYFADKKTVYALDATDGQPQWQASTDGMIDHAPTVANDTVYVSGRKTFALSTEDGAARWTTDLGDSTRLSQSPAVTDDTVVVTDGARARIWALAANDRTVRWTVGSLDGSAGTPSIADGTTYVPITRDSGDGLVAFDLRSGDQKWWVPVRNLDTSSLPPAIDDGIYIADREGFLYSVEDPEWLDWRANGIGSMNVGENVYLQNNALRALDTETGKKRWREEGDTPPVSANGMVYETDWSAVVVYSPDGTQQWRSECDGGITTVPAVTDDRVVVGGDGWVTAFDATTGVHVWTSTGDCGGLGSVDMVAVHDETAFALVNGRVVALDADGEQWSTGDGVRAVAVDDAVYTGTDCNEVVAYDFDGTELWRVTLEDGDTVTSLVPDDGLYAVTSDVTSTGTDSRDWLVSLDDGSVSWTFHPKFLPFGSLCEPVVGDETVYVGASDRRVYALSASDGAERRRFETGGEVESVAVDDERVYATSDGTYAFR
ncbi:PQQ-binding-like beta-propeller repeat protein [Haladaptatus sp.]|uniref:outer membrane protein assembly factor BamB family protein n=1 Tax=Haladaptatus sp. TaxID=1973141 RepID=UPI003C6F5F82